VISAGLCTPRTQCADSKLSKHGVPFLACFTRCTREFDLFPVRTEFAQLISQLGRCTAADRTYWTIDALALISRWLLSCRADLTGQSVGIDDSIITHSFIAVGIDIAISTIYSVLISLSHTDKASCRHEFKAINGYGCIAAAKCDAGATSSCRLCYCVWFHTPGAVRTRRLIPWCKRIAEHARSARIAGILTLIGFITWGTRPASHAVLTDIVRSIHVDTVLAFGFILVRLLSGFARITESTPPGTARKAINALHLGNWYHHRLLTITTFVAHAIHTRHLDRTGFTHCLESARVRALSTHTMRTVAI
jgi:hypothetical protein